MQKYHICLEIGMIVKCTFEHIFIEIGLFKKIYFHMWVFACIYLCIVHEVSTEARRGQQSLPLPLKKRCHVGAENQT